MFTFIWNFFEKKIASVIKQGDETRSCSFRSDLSDSRQKYSQWQEAIEKIFF